MSKELLAELAHVKAMFQLRTIAMHITGSPLPSPEESISVAPDTSDEPPLETAKAGATGDPA